MAIEPVKIPQNVYIEDRIVGPLTLRQTMIMALGGGLSYGLYITLAKASGGHLGIVPTVIVWIPCGLAVIFALIRINDLSLFRICLLLIERLNKPSQRTWAPRKGLTIHIRTSNAMEEKTRKEVEDEQKIRAANVKTESRIEELSSLLDHPIVPLEGDHAAPTAPAMPLSEPSEPEEMRSEPQQPRRPVDPKRIRASEDSDDLSAYSGVFRDISPS